MNNKSKAMDSVKPPLRRRRYMSMETLSFEPRASLYRNFLSKKECEHLINLGRPHMEPSYVFDDENPGKYKTVSSHRTSMGTFLARGQDTVVLDIEKRIADYTSIPLENGENLQVLNYEVGQKSDPHYDYFSDNYKIKIGSQRAATVVMYLSDVEEGGETFFPNAKKSDGIISKNWRASEKCMYVKPKMGDALLFWNTRLNGTVDPLSLHGSAPVVRGNKWACTKMLHDGRYTNAATPVAFEFGGLFRAFSAVISFVFPH